MTAARATAGRRQHESQVTDRNERWWPYDNLEPSESVDPLLGEIGADPTGIFWG